MTSPSAPSPFRFSLPSAPAVHLQKRRKLSHDFSTASDAFSGTPSRIKNQFKFPASPAAAKKPPGRTDDSDTQNRPSSSLHLVPRDVRETKTKHSDISDAFTPSQRPCTPAKPLRPLSRVPTQNSSRAVVRQIVGGDVVPDDGEKSTVSARSLTPHKKRTASDLESSAPQEQENAPPSSARTAATKSTFDERAAQKTASRPFDDIEPRIQPRDIPAPRPETPRRPPINLTRDTSTPPSAQPPPNPPTFVTPAPSKSAWRIPTKPSHDIRSSVSYPRPVTPRPASRHGPVSVPSVQFTPKPTFSVRPPTAPSPTPHTPALTAQPSFYNSAAVTTATTATTITITPTPTNHLTAQPPPRPRFSLPPAFPETSSAQTGLSTGTLAEVFSPHKRKAQRFVNGGWAEEVRGLVFAVAGKGVDSKGNGRREGEGCSEGDGLGDVRNLLRGLM